jgi:hypothetical protein
MAQSKEQKQRFIPDLLPSGTIIEVVKIAPDGSSKKREMTFGEFKALKKQKGFTYRSYQSGVSQFFNK